MVTQALHFEQEHSGQLLRGKLQSNNIHNPAITLRRQSRSSTQLTYAKYIAILLPMKAKTNQNRLLQG